MSGKRRLLICMMSLLLSGCGRPNGASVSTAATEVGSQADSAALNALSSGTVTVEVPAQAKLDLKASHAITFAGWAFDDVHKLACSSVEAVIDNKKTMPAKYGLSRSDVATVFKNYSLNAVGYAFILTAKELGPGLHHVFIVCIDSIGVVGHRSAITYSINVAS